MRLELLCEMVLVYRHEDIVGGPIVLVRPYGSEEGLGYGEGDGTVQGARINGKLRWVNHPSRRSDGVMLPDTHGIIRTDDDAVVMFSLQGRTALKDGKALPLLTVLFEAEDERYTWLNTTLCVLEGVFAESMQARVYMCINEMLEQP